jgi:hypothetical protein
MKMAVFWVVAPCSLVEVYQRFRGPCCLHHQGDEASPEPRRQSSTLLMFKEVVDLVTNETIRECLLFVLKLEHFNLITVKTTTSSKQWRHYALSFKLTAPFEISSPCL